MKKLSEAEFEIMKVLWSADKAFSSNEILDCVKGKINWKLAALMTSLARMVEKGYVYCDRTTRTNLYSATISKERYRVEESESLLEKMYDRSATNLIASLHQGNKMSKKDIEELREYINKIELGDE